MRNVGMRELEKVQEGGDRTYIKGAVVIRRCVKVAGEESALWGS